MILNSIRSALILICVAGSSWAGDSMPMNPQTASGMVVTDPSGMTLYTFDKDTPGMSACVGGCATLWIPYTAAADAKAHGDWALITREDGSRQWSYKGKPLYKWTKDMKAGDSTGDGFKGIWHVAKP